MALTYGYLQGTFGLPYGGYCVRPQHLDDILLNAGHKDLQMFCILGRMGEVQEWLKLNDRMVSNVCTTQDTFTHDLMVEIYSQDTWLTRLFKGGKLGMSVQLVIRIARTWDQGKAAGSANSQFKPVARILVPAGVTLAEIGNIVETMELVSGEEWVDATRNKPLLNKVLTRVSTRGEMIKEKEMQSGGINCLPKYEFRKVLPPTYKF